VVDVPTKEEFDALVAIVEALGVKVTALEAQIVEMPQDVKDAAIKLLEWLRVVTV
jgi:uncharacterized HAD superfamily protein